MVYIYAIFYYIPSFLSLRKKNLGKQKTTNQRTQQTKNKHNNQKKPKTKAKSKTKKLAPAAAPGSLAVFSDLTRLYPPSSELTAPATGRAYTCTRPAHWLGASPLYGTGSYAMSHHLYRLTGRITAITCQLSPLNHSHTSRPCSFSPCKLQQAAAPALRAALTLEPMVRRDQSRSG